MATYYHACICKNTINNILSYKTLYKIFFYKKNDSKSLRKKLEKLLTSKNLLKKNSEIGYRRLNNFDLKNNIKSHKHIYESFLK